MLASPRRPAGPPARRPVVLTLLIVAVACGSLDTTLPLEQPSAPVVHASYGSGAICTTENSYLFRKNCWNAGQTITLKVPANQLSSANAARDDWNQYLEEDASAPRFAVNLSAGDVLVSNAGTTSTDKYCGTFDGDNLTWIVITGSTDCDQNASTGSWGAALRQELVGILGWSEDVEKVPDRFEQGLTTHCVAYLDKFVRVINDQVCVHEAEGVVLAYRNLESTVTDPGNFWRDSVYMHVRIKADTNSLSTVDTVQVVADTFYSGGFGGGGMPAQMAASGHIPIAKPTNGSVTYSSSNSTFLAYLSAGRFRGVSPGTAWARAKPSCAPSTKTRWWLPFKERGDSIPLTVVAAPPPPPPAYVVTSDQTPITTPGSHIFQAHIGDASTQIFWQVDDSRTTGIDPDTTFSTYGQYATLNVGAGSYTLRFRVQFSAAPPYWHQQDIPVCTEGGEALQGGKAGGGSTNAVENCPPSGEQ